MSTNPNLEITEVKGMQAGRVPLWDSVKLTAKAVVGLTARGAPIPPEDRSLGFDIYAGNGVINWQDLYNQGSRFAIFKATQGVSIQDSQFKNSRTNIDALMPWGCYHFLTTSAGSTQANYFLDFVEGNWGTMPPVVDVELSSVDSAIIWAYAVRIHQRTGIYPLLYTSAYFWDKVYGTHKAEIAAVCELWVAHWKTLSPILPSNWSAYRIHQFDDNWNGVLIDPNYTRTSWLAQFQPGHDNWYWDMTNEARAHGWTVRDPEA